MSIEIIQVITLEEFKETGVAGHFDDDTIKAAINTSYIRLNALCNQNIKKRWNITDTTDPLYLKEEYKEITKQAFFLQTEYNLVNNLNLSSEGSQQESLGSWNHSYNNPKEKPFICDGVQDMLQQATLFVPVKSVSLNVANNKCVDINDICGELPAGDKYDLSFVRWGEANAKFLPKNIGIEFANKILITDENGYIRTTDIDPMLINYLTKGEASVIYQRIQDERLLTTDKTIVGAINELFTTTPSTINWDTEPTAGHGEGYAVSSEGIKTYVDAKETNLQSQITANATAISTEIGHREDADTYLQSQITTNTDNIALKQNITDNNLQTTSKEVVGAINELKTKIANIPNPIYQHTIFFRTGTGLFNFSVKFTNNSNSSYTYIGACQLLAHLNPIQSLTGTTGFQILQTFNSTNNDLYYIAYVDITDLENIKWHFKKVGNNNWLDAETELGAVSLVTQTTIDITQ